MAPWQLPWSPPNTPPRKMADERIYCRDECGRNYPAASIESSGWEYLQIQRRWRCVECWRALRMANRNERPERARHEPAESR